jgi:hypothetical protein
MSMRSQVYEWDAGSTDVSGSPMTTTQFGSALSIFVGGFGNNITKPAETTATQFCVIEDIAVTPSAFINSATVTNNSTAATYRGLNITNPGVAGNNGSRTGIAGPRAYVQIRINTTDYFLDPDNVGNDGVPGSASPYPRSVNFQPCFTLYPDVYVLPGQTWDVRITAYQSNNYFGADGVAGTLSRGELQCFVKYTLYDGPDALIANKLLEMGISVNPGNVDWYKRTLIQSQGM